MQDYSAVSYIQLIGKQVEQLKPILDKLGWAVPHPVNAVAVTAVYQGRVVGFFVLQLIPHAEPMWVSPEVRGTGIAEELLAKGKEILVESGAKGWLSICTNPFSERLAAQLGMEPAEKQGVLYVKQEENVKR